MQFWWEILHWRHKRKFGHDYVPRLIVESYPTIDDPGYSYYVCARCPR